VIFGQKYDSEYIRDRIGVGERERIKGKQSVQGQIYGLTKGHQFTSFMLHSPSLPSYCPSHCHRFWIQIGKGFMQRVNSARSN
jgi:hypothetical protein